jgi:hypothetical protein
VTCYGSQTNATKIRSVDAMPLAILQYYRIDVLMAIDALGQPVVDSKERFSNVGTDILLALCYFLFL